MTRTVDRDRSKGGSEGAMAHILRPGERGMDAWKRGPLAPAPIWRDAPIWGWVGPLSGGTRDRGPAIVIFMEAAGPRWYSCEVGLPLPKRGKGETVTLYPPRLDEVEA